MMILVLAVRRFLKFNKYIDYNLIIMNNKVLYSTPTTIVDWVLLDSPMCAGGSNLTEMETAVKVDQWEQVEHDGTLGFDDGLEISF